LGGQNAAMPLSPTRLADLLDHGFDSLIDVRSPGEFALDRIPGAISLPVLSDAERARVGTVYAQVSPFAARKIGAALVARNTAAHVETALATYDGAWRPLVYCWRGGQRSGAFALILREIGWRAVTVAGGYRAWRRLVKAALYDAPWPLRLVLLDGDTGTAKTAILHRMAALGVQVLDLEGMAAHRGSMLGAQPGGQPAQTGFESALAAALARLDPARPLLVEAESSRIGRIVLPPALWAAMCAAPRIEIAAPVAARATYLAQNYADICADPGALAARLDALRAYCGHRAVDGWHAMLRAAAWTDLAQALITQHYDPAYRRSRALHAADIRLRLGLEDLGDQDLLGAARRIATLISDM
jgi:tRNA 2-selenouridine synthase